jgi:hypothetical protein
MHRTGNARQERLIRIVQADKFYLGADREIGPDKLAHSFRRTAARRRQAIDDVEYQHG